MSARLPEVPAAVPRTGSGLSAWIGRSVLSLLGWRVEGAIPPRPKMVLIVAPHSSAWDFVIGLAAKLALRLDSAYLAKASLFRWPLSVLLRRTGGIPVDRRAHGDLVRRMAELFAERERMLLTLAPEGTRQRVSEWKTGFYRIAEAAGVPVLPVALDYGAKAVSFGPLLLPTGDLESETARLRAFFEDKRRKR
jgi:1-acyl-sn-glycerol-3-phosphate acyltransferase